MRSQQHLRRTRAKHLSAARTTPYIQLKWRSVFFLSIARTPASGRGAVFAGRRPSDEAPSRRATDLAPQTASSGRASTMSRTAPPRAEIPQARSAVLRGRSASRPRRHRDPAPRVTKRTYYLCPYFRLLVGSWRGTGTAAVLRSSVFEWIEFARTMSIQPSPWNDRAVSDCRRNHVRAGTAAQCSVPSSGPSDPSTGCFEPVLKSDSDLATRYARARALDVGHGRAVPGVSRHSAAGVGVMKVAAAPRREYSVRRSSSDEGRGGAAARIFRVEVFL